jgi:hypothetical protein
MADTVFQITCYFKIMHDSQFYHRIMQTASKSNENEHFPYTGQREAEHRKCKKLTYYCIYILRAADTYK